jgi:hypothetical protein
MEHLDMTKIDVTLFLNTPHNIEDKESEGIIHYIASLVDKIGFGGNKHHPVNVRNLKVVASQVQKFSEKE